MQQKTSGPVLYPGSFDPITNGHLDIIRRAGALFGTVCVAVFAHPAKRALFSAEERVELLREATRDLPGVMVAVGTGLVVDYARSLGAPAIIRGVRDASDVQHEAPMARMNRHMAPDIETVFLLASPEVAHISSSLVKELASYRASLAGLVPPGVEAMLIAKLDPAPRGGPTL